MKKRIGFQDVAGFVLRHWLSHPFLFAGLLAGRVVTFGCEIMLPVMSKAIVDAVSVDAEGASTAQGVEALAFFLGLYLVAEASRTATFFLWIDLACSVMQRIISDGFSRVQRFSSDWHANNFAGATVRKITRGMWAYDQFSDTIFIGLLPSTIMLVGLSVMLGFHWPIVGASFFAAVIVFVTVSILLAGRWVGPANELFADQDSALGGTIADAVTCNAVVKTFAAEAREDERLKTVLRDWKRKATVAWRRGTWVGLIQAGLIAAMALLLLGLGLWLWQRGQITQGGIALILTTFFVMQGYLREVGQHVRNAQQAVNEMTDLVEFIHARSEEGEGPGRPDLAASGGAITFDRVGFHYKGHPDPLFSDLDVCIRPGERIALVGASGSGKSTFVKLIQRLHDVTAGRVLIDGQTIADVSIASLRRAIALVPQEPILFHRSLAENIGYARPGVSQAQIEWAARQAHAHAFITRLPDGYETLVGERGVKLSGGERQRVAIARAFIADAPILILDEATSSLDSVTEALIQESLGHLMEGRTTILIAHRLSTVREVDRILVFARGKIVEEGTHAALMERQDGPYRRLYESQHPGQSEQRDLSQSA